MSFKRFLVDWIPFKLFEINFKVLAITLLKESNYLEIHMGDKNNFVEIKICWEIYWKRMLKNASININIRVLKVVRLERPMLQKYSVKLLK